MPISIDQVDSQIEVEPNSGQADGAHKGDLAQAMQQWQELAQQQALRDRRTAAWGFDD